MPGTPKKYPLKNFANFSRTAERYDIKVYTLITHSVIRMESFITLSTELTTLRCF